MRGEGVGADDGGGVWPVSPRGGLVRLAWVSETGPGKLVRDAVIFAVHMPNRPVAPSLGKLLAQVIAFSQEDAQMLAVAAPLA